MNNSNMWLLILSKTVKWWEHQLRNGGTRNLYSARQPIWCFAENMEHHNSSDIEYASK